jgi:cytoskeletal protein CcmA (bactofilin family)
MSLFGKPETKPAEPPTPPHRPAAAPPVAPVARAATTPSACVIGPKIKIIGELSGDEDVLIEGSLEGEIRISRDLRVGAGGVVKAKVSAQSIIVSGEIVGDCEANGRVELQSTGKLTGNIRAPKIVIAEGAMFRGNSDMSGKKDERKEKAVAY